MVGAFDVHAVGALPFDRDRLALITGSGFDGASFDACAHGLLTSAGGARVLVLAHDATDADATLAVAELLASRPAAASTARRSGRSRPGRVVSQRFKECGPADELVAYRLEVGGARAPVRLVRDDDLPTRSVSEATSIDDLVLEEVPYDALHRRDRDAFAAAFPDMAARLGSGRYDDPLAEVRGRKTRYDWTYEDIDGGGDLSSLGMSVLLAVLLTLWHGACARVYVSEHYTAMVAVFKAEGTFALVDPCSSRTNALSLSFDDVDARPVVVRKGMVVEVKVVNKWHVGIVDRVVRPLSHHSRHCASASVQLVASGRVIAIALSSKRWRCSRGARTATWRM